MDLSAGRWRTRARDRGSGCWRGRRPLAEESHGPRKLPPQIPPKTGLCFPIGTRHLFTSPSPCAAAVPSPFTSYLHYGTRELEAPWAKVTNVDETLVAGRPHSFCVFLQWSRQRTIHKPRLPSETARP